MSCESFPFHIEIAIRNYIPTSSSKEEEISNVHNRRAREKLFQFHHTSCLDWPDFSFSELYNFLYSVTSSSVKTFLWFWEVLNIYSFSSGVGKKISSGLHENWIISYKSKLKSTSFIPPEFLATAGKEERIYIYFIDSIQSRKNQHTRQVY